MITAKDMGELFSVMRASYGHLWPYGPDDLAVWLKRLGGFQRHELIDATNQCPRKYPDHPPTLGQFEALVSMPKRASTYLTAPSIGKERQVANYVLLQVLVKVGGVSKFALKNLVDLKNALLEEWQEISKENIADMHSQLLTYAQNDD